MLSSTRADALQPRLQNADARRSVITHALVVAGYLSLGLFAYSGAWEQGWTAWTLPAGLAPGQQDPIQTMWFLAWSPYALLHQHSLLFTRHLNAPYGVNFLWNASVPLLALLGSFVTQVFGPIASYNLWMTVAAPAAATSLYAVALRLGASRLGSVAAGLLYGFGPYMVGQESAHLNLVSVFLFPWILYFLYRPLTDRPRRPVRDGLILAVLLGAQFFVSSELLADAAILSVAGLVLYTASGRRRWRRLAGALPTYLITGAAVALGLAYPVWFQLTGPQRLHGLLPFASYSSTLLSIVAPTSNQLLHDTPWLNTVNQTIPFNLAENGAYLGLPLVLLLLVRIVLVRGNPRGALWAALALTASVIALGPVLRITNTATHLTLPQSYLAGLPLIGDQLPIRFSLFADLFASLALAETVSRIPSAAGAKGSRTGLRTAAAFVVTAAVLIPLLPGAWPYPAARLTVPSYFLQRGRSGPHGTVLSYPFTSQLHFHPMLWQAEARMQYRSVGAYALDSGPNGTGIAVGAPGSLLETTLDSYYAGAPALPLSPLSLTTDRNELRQFGVTTLVAAPVGADPKGAVALFTALAQRPPTWNHGVWVWTVPQ